MLSPRMLNHSGFPSMPTGFSIPDRLIDNIGNLAVLTENGNISIETVAPYTGGYIQINALDGLFLYSENDTLEIDSQAGIWIDGLQQVKIESHPEDGPGCGLFFPGLRTGVDQAAAGASAGEVWLNSTTHVLMVGV